MFSRAAGVRARAKRDFFHGSNFFTETVPTRYRTPLGGFPKCVLIPRYPGTDPNREETLRKYIYRYNITLSAVQFNFLKSEIRILCDILLVVILQIFINILGIKSKAASALFSTKHTDVMVIKKFRLDPMSLKSTPKSLKNGQFMIQNFLMGDIGEHHSVIH